MFKIPSGRINKLPIFKNNCQTSLPVILSTGMANLDEIEKSINVLVSMGQKKVR